VPAFLAFLAFPLVIPVLPARCHYTYLSLEPVARGRKPNLRGVLRWRSVQCTTPRWLHHTAVAQCGAAAGTGPDAQQHICRARQRQHAARAGCLPGPPHAAPRTCSAPARAAPRSGQHRHARRHLCHGLAGPEHCAPPASRPRRVAAPVASPPCRGVPRPPPPEPSVGCAARPALRPALRPDGLRPRASARPRGAADAGNGRRGEGARGLQPPPPPLLLPLPMSLLYTPTVDREREGGCGLHR
jgi:hypothetical protein